MQSHQNSRRKFLARGLELASTIPLIGVLGNNFLRSREYYSLDFSGAELKEDVENKNVIQSLYSTQKSYSDSLENLASAYRDAYYKSRLVSYISIDSEGHPHTKFRTEYYWDEESGVPRKYEVNSWRARQSELSNKFQFLMNEQLVDISIIGNIKVEKRNASRLGQGIINLGVYGIEIGLLLGYEEILSCLRYRGFKQKTLSEKVSEMNTDSQINRRCFFKIGAALSGAITAGVIGEYNDNELGRGESKLKDNIRNSLNLSDISSEQAIKDYFRISTTELVDIVRKDIDISENTLRNGVRKTKVKNSFKNVIEIGKTHYNNLRHHLEGKVNPELAYIVKCGIATENLHNASSSQSLRANTNVLLETLALGGTMAAVIVPLEIVNHKLP